MELIKKDDRWDLYNEDGHKIASTLDGCVNKLSLKNCQAIENGYDLDELVEGFIERTGYHDFDSYSYKLGFLKALSILGDKKFSEEQVLNAFYAGWISKDKLYPEAQSSYKGYLKRHATQQTEWDCIIKMEEVHQLKKRAGGIVNMGKPLLDADGNLILKRK